MKGVLNWQDQKVVNNYDEVTLWSAPFGRLLLENIPMKRNAKLLDIGFGTGFPLIELSQRFGNGSTIYGIDLWKQAIHKAKSKISVLQLNNIKIFEQSASNIPLPNDHLDIVCSNLGVNNFEEKVFVLNEIFRVLKVGGHLCITTNSNGTFKELFNIFKEVMNEMALNDGLIKLHHEVNRRGTLESIIEDIEYLGLKLNKTIEGSTNIRFVDSIALFDHSLIRIGFLESWESMIPEKQRPSFFKNVQKAITKEILEKGEFKISIPILYLEFVKSSSD